MLLTDCTTFIKDEHSTLRTSAPACPHIFTREAGFVKISRIKSNIISAPFQQLASGPNKSMENPTSFRIIRVRSTEDLQATVHLFTAYSSSLGIDLSFQDFATEMQNMPGKYAPPKGELLLAQDESGTPLGCNALRPLVVEGCCEMKRLYTVPSARGLGVGKALAHAIIKISRSLGYHEMRLDTLPSMAGAISLYKSLGFVEISPYYETPISDTIFLSLRLQEVKGSDDHISTSLSP